MILETVNLSFIPIRDGSGIARFSSIDEFTFPYFSSTKALTGINSSRT